VPSATLRADAIYRAAHDPSTVADILGLYATNATKASDPNSEQAPNKKVRSLMTQFDTKRVRNSKPKDSVRGVVPVQAELRSRENSCPQLQTSKLAIHHVPALSRRKRQGHRPRYQRHFLLGVGQRRLATGPAFRIAPSITRSPDCGLCVLEADFS